VRQKTRVKNCKISTRWLAKGHQQMYGWHKNWSFVCGKIIHDKSCNIIASMFTTAKTEDSTAAKLCYSCRYYYWQYYYCFQFFFSPLFFHVTPVYVGSLKVFRGSFGDCWNSLLHVKCPSCHITSSVKALMRDCSQTTDNTMLQWIPICSHTDIRCNIFMFNKL